MKLISYNVRKAIGRDGRRDPGRVLDVLAGVGADVVAIQEGDYRFKGRQAVFDADDIARRTGLRIVDVAPDAPGHGWHGNLLLIGRGLDLVSVRSVELPGLEPRGAYVADLSDDSGRTVRVMGTHLGLMARHRRAQSRIVAGEVDGEMQTFAMGDLNAWGRRPRSLATLRAAMEEAPCGASFPTRWPIGTLDRIFHAGPMRLTGAGVIDTAEARVASDHLPVWASFDWPGSEQG